jgi:hypothetical protein
MLSLTCRRNLRVSFVNCYRTGSRKTDLDSLDCSRNQYAFTACLQASILILKLPLHEKLLQSITRVDGLQRTTFT